MNAKTNLRLMLSVGYKQLARVTKLVEAEEHGSRGQGRIPDYYPRSCPVSSAQRAAPKRLTNSSPTSRKFPRSPAQSVFGMENTTTPPRISTRRNKSFAGSPLKQLKYSVAMFDASSTPETLSPLSAGDEFPDGSLLDQLDFDSGLMKETSRSQFIEGSSSSRINTSLLTNTDTFMVLSSDSDEDVLIYSSPLRRKRCRSHDSDQLDKKGKRRAL